MLQDAGPRATNLSPSKGKAKEKQHWQTDWWDFQLLAERTNRPLEWSQSSIIFTAHPTQPLVTARYFSSSKQFIVPSPTPIISSPGSYNPPTVISVAPSSDWLFAYFPGHGGDGTGCLWKRSSQIDNWIIKEWWGFPPGAGVVAARWLGTSREWITDPISSSSIRLPPRGPLTPVSSPTLLLVTQDHRVHLCYFRHYNPSLKVIACSLDKQGLTWEGRNHLGEERESLKQCFKAAIGLNYYDTSILIATRSYINPPPLTNDAHLENMSPVLSSQVTEQSPPELQSMEWETQAEQSVINITEVQLRFNGAQISLSAEPLSPILHTGLSLTSLNFITIPPSTPPSPRKDANEGGQYYLISTYLDFRDYTSTPKSELVLHAIVRPPPALSSISNKSTWMIHHRATRSFGPEVLTFVTPCFTSSGLGRASVYAGIVDTHGTLPRSPSGAKEFRAGEIRVLHLSDLTDNEDWETLPIMMAVDRMGQDVPLSTAVSPNCVLLSLLSSSLWPMRASIQLLPRPKNALNSPEKLSPPLAASLSSAILSKTAATDITHVLALPSTPIAEVFDVLYHAINTLDNHYLSSPHYSTLAFLGEAMSVYRKRALNTRGDEDNVTARWTTAHDMCSLAACNMAFEISKDGDIYDLDAVWQLIALSTWVVTFTESVMRECVLFSVGVKLPSDSSTRDGSTFDYPLSSPLLLHLVHPFALGNFSAVLIHINHYRTYLGSLSAKGRNAQIGRDILIDLVDNSGIDFSALESLLVASLPESEVLNKDDCRRALAACQPTPGMQPYLARIINQVTQSTILHKATLFIKPSDLIDGVARAPNALKKNKDRDVVLKRILLGQGPSVTCLRCGGRSELGKDSNIGEHTSPRWQVWEKIWTFRCICGGYWTSSESN